jgi:hypothetical protein
MLFMMLLRALSLGGDSGWSCTFCDSIELSLAVKAELDDEWGRGGRRDKARKEGESPKLDGLLGTGLGLFSVVELILSKVICLLSSVMLVF